MSRHGFVGAGLAGAMLLAAFAHVVSDAAKAGPRPLPPPPAKNAIATPTANKSLSARRLAAVDRQPSGNETGESGRSSR